MIAASDDGSDKVGIHVIAVPRPPSFECRLQEAVPSIGKEDAVNISMDILESRDMWQYENSEETDKLESGDTGQCENSEESEPKMPPMLPLINRELNFDTDDFNYSVFKAQFQSNSSVNTMSTCSELKISPPESVEKRVDLGSKMKTIS